MFGNRSGALRRLVGLWLALVLALSGAAVAPARAEGSGMIRVKLTRLGTPASITLETDCAYVLDGGIQMNVPAGSRVTVRAEGGGLTTECCGVKLYCGSSLRLLRCGSAGLRFLSPALANRFCGDLTLSLSGGGISAVLRLYIEEYLCGVVAYEMSDSYPLEALKAQAVAARNYALKKMASRAAKDYDVTDNTSDQVFKGYNAGLARVIQAVNETRGQALYAGGSLASCYYGASNGGQTESTKNAWGSSLSYSTVRDDPYDLSNAAAKQNVATIRRDGSDLNAHLKAALLEGAAAELSARGMDPAAAEIVAIHSIEPRDPKYASPSRLYRSLRFTLTLSATSGEAGAQAQARVSVDVPTYGALEDWYGLSINSASNETVSVEADVDAFRVIFRRWGHGVGMSQRGAQYMAANCGMRFSEILEFYYPTTQLRELSLAAEGAHAPLGEAQGIATARLRLDSPLRAGAGEDSSAAALLRAGLELGVLGVEADWVQVQINGLSGWLPVDALEGDLSEILPTPTATVEPTPTATMEPTPTATVEPTPTATVEPTPTATVEPTPTATVEPTPTATAEPTSTATVEPTPTATVEPTPTATVEPTPTATVEPTLPATVEPTPTATVEPTPTATVDPTPTATVEPTPTATVEPTPTATVKPTLPAIALPTATIVPTAKPGATFAPQPTAVDYPMPTPGPAPAGAEGMLVATGELYAYVNVSSDSTLTLRRAASASSESIGALRRGAQVRMLAFDDEWACVRTEAGATGFVARRYLYLPGSSSGDQPVAKDEPKEAFSGFREVKTGVVFCKRAAVVKSETKLYQSYSTASAALAALPASAKVTVTAYNKKWAYVSCESGKGFVLLKYLRAA